MLEGSFYKINKLEHQENKALAEIMFIASHPIFAGHFPQQPVVPGVCMMEMVQELLERIFEKPLMLQKADSMKFLSMINPHDHSELDMEIHFTTLHDGALNVFAELRKDGGAAFKFKGNFIYC